MSGIYAAAKALNGVYEDLANDGSTADHLDKLITFDSFQKLLGYNEKVALEEKYSHAHGDKFVVRVPGEIRAAVDDV